MPRIEQQVAESEELTIEATVDEILVWASEQLSELQWVLAKVGRRLHTNA